MLILQRKVGLGTVNYWDIGAASFEGSVSVTTQDALNRGLAFRDNGTKMYVTGSISSSILQYTLSTPWVVSSATYDSVAFSVSSEDLPYGLVIKPNGTKMYFIGAFGNTVLQYTLSSAWDMSSASYDSVSYSLGAIGPSDLRFKTDGTKMYVMSSLLKTIRQYTLSTPWVVSSASYDSVSLSVGTQEPGPLGLDFQSDGSKVFIVGNNSVNVHQYTLSTPWLISSGTFDKSFPIPQDTSPLALAFKTDGAKMYVGGSQNSDVYQYGL